MPNLFDRFNAPSPIAWLMFALAMFMTVGAGTWQVERLQWKQGLIAELDEANAQAPIRDLPTSTVGLEALQFHKVQLRGAWVKDVEFHIAPRYLRNQFGYAVVSPLKLADGRIVLINRGWVPAAKKEIETRPESKVRGYAAITGIVRVGDERSFFTPASQPEKNIWFGRDITDMAVDQHLEKVVPVMVDLIGDAETKALPVPSDGIIRMRNDHLGYIITWYGIALGVLVIFVTYHYKKR